jgi:acetolactate synthase regulatory subunit
MTWRFCVVASVQERLLSRILQVLEVQRVSIQFFSGEISAAEARITFVVSSEETRAYRIEALLYRLETVRTVLVTRLLEPPTEQDSRSGSLIGKKFQN